MDGLTRNSKRISCKGQAVLSVFRHSCLVIWTRSVWVNPHGSLRRPLGSRRRLPPQASRYIPGAPLRLPKPLSDQFPVRVCSCSLCIMNRLRKSPGERRFLFKPGKKRRRQEKRSSCRGNVQYCTSCATFPLSA